MIGFKTIADAQRVLAGIRAIEAQQRSPGGQSRHHPGFQGAVLVEITGGPTSGLHPAKVVAWDDFANDYVDRGAVRFKETGGATLTTGTVCIGVFTGATADGEYGIYANLAGGTADESFWAEITAGPTSSAYSWKKVKQVAGVWSDVSPAVTGTLNAYATEVDGTVPVLKVGSTVRMWASQTASGEYECELNQNAGWDWAFDFFTGLVNTGTQYFKGAKLFSPSLTVDTQDTGTQGGTASFAVGSEMFGVGYTTLNVQSNFGTSYQSIDMLGGNVSSGNGMVACGGQFSCVGNLNVLETPAGPSYGGIGPGIIQSSGTYGTVAFEALPVYGGVLTYTTAGGAPDQILLDNATVKTSGSFYIPVAQSYWVGAKQGETVNRSITDIFNTHTVEVTGGLITDWAVSPVSPPTGTGAVVLDTSPTLTTPNLGAATATTINGVAITGSGTLATGTYTLTLTNTASVEGTNTGDQSAASLGLVIGTDTQAWSASLDTLATVTPVADGTYTVGYRLTPGGTDGTITTSGGLITAITEAT